MFKFTKASTWFKLFLGLCLVGSLSSCDDILDLFKRKKKQLKKVGVRFASYNASLNRFNQGDLISDLSSPDNQQAQNVAEIIQITRPDFLALLEFDFDESGQALELFQDNYLSQSQNGADPIDYPYTYVFSSNTGVLSGVDFNNDGNVALPLDAFGFGFFPGQFAFAVLSKYEIVEEEIRTFQNFRWIDMPGAKLPLNADSTSFYSQEALDIFRLSSKNHVDVPLMLKNGKIVHALVAHPTPPVFDGPEDFNGRRNFDEIRLFNDYVNGADYIYDDNGVFGGLEEGARFVIMGDYNADPFDGDATDDPITTQFFANPLINFDATEGDMVPFSLGGVEAALVQEGDNLNHVGNPAFDTADFGEPSPGNLRVDYVLPSANIRVKNSGVFWPEANDPFSRLIGPANSSDHQLVFVDVRI